jgi:beta-glucanase (GH16 family)
MSPESRQQFCKNSSAIEKLILKQLLILACCVAFVLEASAQYRTGWSLVWSDEFTQATGSSPDPAKWGYDVGGNGWGNNELEYYTSRTNNARIENNQLVIEARAESFGGKNYTSARMLTKGKWSWAYGRIEARIKIPRGQGIWPAFWMMGTNIDSAGWPTCGEVDIMENIGKEPGMIHGTAHGPGYSGGSGIGGPYTLPGAGAIADDFHIFAIEWETNRMRWFIDNQPYFTITPTSLPSGTQWVFSQPQFLLLNLAVGGNWPGNPDGTTVFPQRMVVDYVRIYAATNGFACGGNALTNPGLEFSGLANWKLYGAGFNTLLANTTNSLPIHSGSNAFKVFGQFTGGENYSGMYQDIPSVPGRNYGGNGWAITPSGDQIAVANSAWLEVSFRDLSSNVLSLYRSAVVDPTSAPGTWLNLAITNQFNPTTFALIGTATNLIAPSGTAFVRYQILFRQPASANGSVLFDDLNLTTPGAAGIPFSTSVARSAGILNLSFQSYLGLTNQVRFKNDLSDPTWQVLTNSVGDGTRKTMSDVVGAFQRYYQVGCLCE